MQAARDADSGRSKTVEQLAAQPTQEGKFRRRQSFGPYIADCPSEELMIQLDGSPHDSEKAWKRDCAQYRWGPERTSALLVWRPHLQAPAILPAPSLPAHSFAGAGLISFVSR
ncbi:MAG: DUF559 domain-containing protein [Burkholderiales bacterium]